MVRHPPHSSDSPDAEGAASGLVRIGDLSDQLGLPVWTLRRMADAGRIPSARTEGGHRMFDASRVREALSLGVGGVYGAFPVEQRGTPSWSRTYPLEGLEEHLVWRAMCDLVPLNTESPAAHILEYSMSEMINNAVDHSGGHNVDVSVWVTDELLAFQVRDDGEGAFDHLRRGLGLADDFEAISALTKGKQTTWRERHTGEGVFFTSKMNDVFQIQANGKRWTVDNVREDQAVGVSPVSRGTTVDGQIDAGTQRTSADVFTEYMDDDFGFTRTRPTVKLASLGMRFASRSEAKRLVQGLDDFNDIDLDFSGVASVGQGFVDEVFRVWQQHNPTKTITPINMNDAVEFMVRRGLRAR